MLSWLNITLKNITIRCKKLATIVSVRKYVARRTTLRQAKTGKHECRNVAATSRCCYISATAELGIEKNKITDFSISH